MPREALPDPSLILGLVEAFRCSKIMFAAIALGVFDRLALAPATLESVATFDLSRFRRLVDLGSATGHLAMAACQRYAALRAMVLDLPGVVSIAREQVQPSAAANRIEVVAGDFFADPLPEADLFALGRI